MHRLFITALALIAVLAGGIPGRAADGGAESLWDLARTRVEDHRVSTLFTAQDVRRHLATEEGLTQALAWCRASGVTKVYLESFRDGYDAEAAVLGRARDRFRAEGFEVAGGITTTSVGKRSNRWNIIACYTDIATQDRLAAIAEAAARLFDEIMVDDFWFTDCSCPECDAARVARRVTLGGRVTEVAGDSWEDYRRELMRRLSMERLIAPARRVNPRCTLILKYPQWYDVFHERGYDVEGQTRIFDRIWVGTETRDYRDSQWGGTVQYEAYFIMRWLGGIGGEKCGGGWFDWLGTTEATYLEQARQTVLGGARESVLFCYGGLQDRTGPANIAAFRRELPSLLDLAREVRRREVQGIAAYKPPNSRAGAEKRLFDFVGMLGLPLVPCHVFPTNAPAAFFSLHALKDPEFAVKLAAMEAAGTPVLLTDGLAAALPAPLGRPRPGVQVLAVRGDPKGVLELGRAELDALREPLLKPLGTTLSAPSWVSLMQFRDGSRVLQNFTDAAVEVELNGRKETLPARGWAGHWQ